MFRHIYIYIHITYYNLFWKLTRTKRVILPTKTHFGWNFACGPVPHKRRSTWICFTSFNWSLTQLLSPPHAGSPQVTTPASEMAAKALVEAWMAETWPGWTSLKHHLFWEPDETCYYVSWILVGLIPLYLGERSHITNIFTEAWKRNTEEITTWISGRTHQVIQFPLPAVDMAVQRCNLHHDVHHPRQLQLHLGELLQTPGSRKMRSSWSCLSLSVIIMMIAIMIITIVVIIAILMRVKEVEVMMIVMMMMMMMMMMTTTTIKFMTLMMLLILELMILMTVMMITLYSHLGLWSSTHWNKH